MSWDYSKLIINLAPTGIIPTKADNPYLPVTPEEIAEDCVRCYNAGVSIVHLHARDKNGAPTYRKEVYSDIIRRIRSRCSDLIICVSTSGRVYRSFEQRSQVLELTDALKPDMASLTLGSTNFSRDVSVNTPDIIQALAFRMHERGIVPELEIFDTKMLDYGKRLIDKGVLQKPFYFNLFLDTLGSMKVASLRLASMVNALPQNAVWSAAGIGRCQLMANAVAIAMGGHVRVGLEDNLYLDVRKERLASNLKLVERLVGIARAMGREVASPMEARRLIGLPETVPLISLEEKKTG